MYHGNVFKARRRMRMSDLEIGKTIKLNLNGTTWIQDGKFTKANQDTSYSLAEYPKAWDIEE